MVDMWPFKKDETKERGASLGDSRNRVGDLSSQRMSDQEITNKMKDEGYRESDIDTGMRESLKTAVGPSERRDFLPPKERFAMDEQAPPVEESIMPAPMPPGEVPGSQAPPAPVPVSAPEPPDPALPAPPSASGRPQPPFGFNEFGSMQGREPQGVESPESFDLLDESIEGFEDKQKVKETSRRELEETVESVVEDKWSLVKSEIDDVHMSIGNLDSRMASVEDTVNDIRKEKKTEVQQIDEKIDTYKESMSEVSARMEAMESALKDSLTPMMQSMRSLNDTVKAIKKK